MMEGIMAYVYYDKENDIKVVQEAHTVKLMLGLIKAHLTVKEARNIIAAMLVATDAVEESKSKGERT
jgi:hypothetical protein